MRAQSCSGWYRRSAGYDSVAATSGLLLVEGLLGNFRAPRLPAHVDHELGAGRARGDRDVAQPDADVEHRRDGAGGDLAPAFDAHALARDRLLGHPERHELPFRSALLDLAQPPGAGEVGAERARPAEARGDRVPWRSDVVPFQRLARLYPQRVASAEAGRRHAAG